MIRKDIKDKNIILFGCGATGKATLHYLDKYFSINPKNFLIIDKIDYTSHPDVQKWIKKGARYAKIDIIKNYKDIISKLNENDIIINLSNRTPSLKMVEECLKNNIHYIDTSLEDEESPNELKKHEESLKNTYQYSHNVINTLKRQYQNSATCLLTAGMNPGTISTLTRLAILFLAKNTKNTPELNLYMNEKDFPRLCEYLGVEIIHCSEDDTAHYTDNTKLKTFTNTWCPVAFTDEGSDNCQCTWGTDQKFFPKGAEMLSDYVINFNKPSLDIYCESYVPQVGKIIGTVISHSESISGADFYSTPTHSPTIHYVYKFSPVANESLKKLQKKYIGGTMPDYHVLNNYEDKFDGIDRVGALILTKDKRAVWAGSILSNKDQHIGLNSGTTAQVAISVLSFVSWMIDNPNKGANFPEVVDEQYMLKKIKPYYGFHIGFVDYKPKSLQFKDLQRSKKDFENQF